MLGQPILFLQLKKKQHSEVLNQYNCHSGAYSKRNMMLLCVLSTKILLSRSIINETDASIVFVAGYEVRGEGFVVP